MSSITASGSTLQAALEVAVAELVSADTDNVSVRIDAPGIDEVVGAFAINLRVEPVAQRGYEGPADVGAASDDDTRGDDRSKTHAEPDEVQAGEERIISPEELDEEADAAADFIEGLLDALDLPGDLRISIHPDHAEIEIVDIGSGALIGRRGQTLEAIQELVRCTLQRQFQRRARVKIDAEGYRTRRLEKLIEKAEESIDAVLATGEPERLEPMDVFERKAVHQLVAEYEGLESHSQGREPARRVVIEQI